MIERAVCGLMISRSVGSIGNPERQITRVFFVLATRSRYVEAYERISGLNFADWIGA